MRSAHWDDPNPQIFLIDLDRVAAPERIRHKYPNHNTANKRKPFELSPEKIKAPKPKRRSLSSNPGSPNPEQLLKLALEDSLSGKFVNHKRRFGERVCFALQQEILCQIQPVSGR